MEPTALYPVYVDETPTAPAQETPDNGVSLSPPASDPDTGVSLSSPGNAPVTLPQDVAQERAKKVQEGIGEHLQKTTDEIRQDINNGKEDVLRNQAASSLNQQKNQQLQQQLIDLANKKGGPLDEGEVAAMLDPYNPKNKPVNPQSVVETQYATKYIGSIQEAIGALPSNPVQEATQEIPEDTDQAFLKGSELVARMEAYKKIREDQEARIGQQSYVGRGVDALKQMWQPYNEFSMRGLVPGVDLTEGLDIGNNLQAQADKVWRLPFDQSIEVAKNVTDKLAEKNPQLALRFSQYLEGLSSNDRLLDGVFTYMLPMDIAGLGKAGLGIARKVSLANRTNTAVKQLVKVADKIQTDKAARAEAVGDLDKAAEVKSTDLVLQSMNGTSDPIKVATDDTLLTLFNQDKAKIAADPGNLKREQVTRIQDAYDASGQTLLQRIVDAARINRIPMALATQNAVRIVKDAVKEYYPGIRNAILDISNPLYEPKSNTYWHEITFGNFGGNLFSNPETAKNFAKLHGLDGIHIVEGNGPVSSKVTEKMLEDKAKIENNILDWEQTVQRRKAEASNPKLTVQERAAAKEQADNIKNVHIPQARQAADDLGLRLKGRETYDRVKLLESEINDLKVRNKELRKSTDKGEHITQSIRWAGEQVKAKADEINAIKSGKADVIRPNTVEQQGVGFKIIARRPLVETDRAIRDLMIRDPSGKLIPEATSTSSQTGFKALFNAAVGKYRGADDTLALNESINRKIGTYTQSLFKEWAAQEAAYIRQISSGVVRQDPITGANIPWIVAKPKAIIGKLTGQVGQKYNEFVRTLDYARDALDDKGKPGYFFETPGELNNHYLKNYGRSPDFTEHQGYFAFVRMVEGDRVMREIAEFRNRARLGTEQHSISARGPDGKNVKSDFFDGISKKSFPGGDDVMMIMAKKLGEEKLVNLGGAGIGPTKLAEYKDMVKNGRLRVIEVYAPEYKPLRDFSDVAGNEHVRYILTDQSESKPIEFNHVNRRGGGHFEYDYDHFLKQANMYHQYEAGTKGRYRSVYTGDTTFMPLLNRVMGRDIAKKLNTVRDLIREGNHAEAERFTRANLPIEWDKLSSMFKPGRDANGKVTPAALDLDPRNPFTVVDKGKSVFDMNRDLEEAYGKGTFKDGTRSGSLNKQFQVAFNTERESSGLTHLEDIGTQGSPLYKYAPTGRMVDPITTMNRSLNRIVNTVFMDDYKMYAVEHWLREAEDHLKTDLADSAHSSPFYVFQAANAKTAFKPGTPWETIQNLLSNQYKIQQFIGIPSSFDTAVHAVTQWLVDAAYSSFGPESARSLGAKAVTIVPLWMLNHIKDPVTIARSITFHAKLGLFNPAQLLVQMNTFATILSVSPFHGTAGTYATLLHSWTAINKSPEFLKFLDNAATKVGILGQSRWKAGELTEAMDLLHRTGFAKVAGEYANLNTALKTDFVGNDFKGVLNAGTWFFTKGEQSTRIGAWYTAYREFREANPTGPISKTDLGNMLQRADLLTVNMSRASNSAMNSGGLSLTTQFLTYQMRMAELFMGSRIDKMAKLRLATFYAALYGAPSAVGLTGIPMANSIRAEAIQRNYNVGENWITTAVMDGLPAVFAAWITGKGDFQKGNNYNFGDRYGSPGFTQLTDAMKSNVPWYMMLAGASGTTLGNTLSSTDPFFKVVYSMLQPSNKDKQYKLTVENFVDFFKEVSSVNQGWKLYTAINTNKWISKNEGYVGDVTKWNAAFMAMTGLSPQQQDDAFVISGIKKGEIEFQKWTQNKATIEYHRYIQAVKDGNPEQAKVFATNVNTMLVAAGFPLDRQAVFYANAAKGYETSIHSQDYAFATKGVPQTRSDFLGIPMPFNTQTNIPQTRYQQYQDKNKLESMKQ